MYFFKNNWIINIRYSIRNQYGYVQPDIQLPSWEIKKIVLVLLLLLSLNK